jgi:hypothetical protein
MVIVIAALVAWLIPGAAAWIAWRTARWSCVLLRHGTRTTGQVTVANGNRCWVQYSVGGMTYQIRSEWYPATKVGAEAPVLYPPDSPQDGCVHFWQDLWMPPILWLAVAVFFAVLDIWY